MKKILYRIVLVYLFTVHDIHDSNNQGTQVEHIYLFWFGYNWIVCTAIS